MQSLRMTAHAAERAAHRSIRLSDLEAFERFADFEVPARNGAVHLRLSRRGAKDAAKAGLEEAQIARLVRLNVVECAGQVLTIYRLPPPTLRRPKQTDVNVIVEEAA